VTKADSDDPTKTTVYRQLAHIRENWKARGKLSIHYIDSYSNVNVNKDEDSTYNK